MSESLDEFPFFSCAIGLLIHFLPDFPSNSSLLQKVREDSLDALLAASDAAIAMSQHTLTGFSGGDAGSVPVDVLIDKMVDATQRKLLSLPL